MRVLALILDALDVDNLHAFDMQMLQERYAESGRVFTSAARPHTAEANPMLWGGVRNTSRYWVEPESEDAVNLRGETKAEASHVQPALYFDRDKGGPVDDARGFDRETAYAGDSFVWDDLAAAGYDARALQVPIVLPPFSTENATDELESSWFPDTKERQRVHIRKKPKLIRDQFKDGAEFVATSIQMPDKWLHAVGEERIDPEWTAEEAPVLDARLDSLLRYCEANGIEWVICGDHGSPTPGAMKVRGGEYLLPRHEKQSVIMASEGLDPPTYSDEYYQWLLDVYDVHPVDECVLSAYGSDADRSSVDSRLEALGYR